MQFELSFQSDTSGSKPVSGRRRKEIDRGSGTGVTSGRFSFWETLADVVLLGATAVAEIQDSFFSHRKSLAFEQFPLQRSVRLANQQSPARAHDAMPGDSLAARDRQPSRARRCARRRASSDAFAIWP